MFFGLTAPQVFFRPDRPSPSCRVRIRAKRGHQIAAVAVARKLTVLCWNLLTKDEDYRWVRPALVASAFRVRRDSNRQD